MYGQHDHARALRSLAVARVGEEIRKRREAAGITLRALARAIGVSPPFMSDVEHGRRTTVKLSEIETALKLKAGTLWGVAGLCRHCGGSGLDAPREKGDAMKTCEKCGVDLEEYECSRTNERHTVTHRPSQCLANLTTQRDRLAARLAEAERGTAAMASGYESQIVGLRAELETTKAQLAEAERLLAWTAECLDSRDVVGSPCRDAVDRVIAAQRTRYKSRERELAECRAELEKWRTHNAWLVDNSVKKGQEAEAAEARAERTLRNLDATLRDSSRNLAERCHAAVVAIHNALAETEKEKP